MQVSSGLLLVRRHQDDFPREPPSQRVRGDFAIDRPGLRRENQPTKSQRSRPQLRLPWELLLGWLRNGPTSIRVALYHHLLSALR